MLSLTAILGNLNVFIKGLSVLKDVSLILPISFSNFAYLNSNYFLHL